MADEARITREAGDQLVLLTTSITAHEVVQLPSGLAGVNDRSGAVNSGGTANPTSHGCFTVIKSTGFVALPGNCAYWDHSANACTYKKVNDRDFYIGRFTQDAASAATFVEVDLNADPPYDIDINRDPVRTVIVGTQGLNTMGVFRRGGCSKFLLSATNEAQKMDILSKDGFATGANAIVEWAFEVADDGAGTAVDVSIGAASATHATDASSITNRLFVHFDANAVSIYAESADGTTTVALTDTTIDYTLGSRHQVWFDMRNPADVQIYIDGSLVLGSTVFDVSASASVWYLLAHVEKTSSTDAYDMDIDWGRVHYAEQ